MTRKQFGYTIKESGSVTPDYYGDYAYKHVWIKFGEIGGGVQSESYAHFLEASLSIRNDGQMSLSLSAGGTNPERYANAAALLSKAKTEEGEITPATFIDLLRKLPAYVYTYDWGNIPVSSIGKTAYRLVYYVDREHKYGPVFCDTQEQAKLHFMKLLTEAADLETMESWGYNSFFLEATEIASRNQVVTLDKALESFTMADCSRESLERAQSHKEEREKEQAEFEAAQLKRKEEARKAKEQAEKEKAQESEGEVAA